MAVSYGPVFATAYDATGGMLALEVPKPGVAYAPVVDLVESPDVLADALDLPWTRSFRHGFCWGLLVPDGSRLVVVVMGRDGPDLAGDGVVAGRLSDEDVVRWGPLWSGRAVRVSVLVEATPGLFDLEVRFRTNAATDSATTVLDLGPRASETPAPTPSAALDAVRPAEASTEVASYAGTTAKFDLAPEAGADVVPESVTHVDAASPVEHGLAAALGAVSAAPAATAVEPTPEAAAPGVPTVARVPEPAPALDLGRLVPPSAPAAWYVDPSDDASWRWWDGSRWTTDAAPRPGSRDGSGPA